MILIHQLEDENIKINAKLKFYIDENERLEFSNKELKNDLKKIINKQNYVENLVNRILTNNNKDKIGKNQDYGLNEKNGLSNKLLKNEIFAKNEFNDIYKDIKNIDDNQNVPDWYLRIVKTTNINNKNNIDNM